MFKKTLAMLLCIAVMLSLGTMAFAEESVRIKVEAEAATEKHVNLEPISDYTGNHIKWNGTDTYAGRPVDTATGYHYSAGWGTSVIHFCPNDWYTYTFEVATAGTYNFGFKGGTDRVTPFILYVDGSETKEDNAPMPVPASGNYPFTENTIHTLHLDAGTHTIKISLTENKNHNIAADYFYLDLAEADPDQSTDSETGVTASAEILKGTATVDGKLDEAYKSSLCISVDKSSVIWVPKEDPDNVSAKVYFMHDGEYLYICGVITGDSTIVNTNPQTANEWAVDGLDIWFLLPELPLRTKFTMDAFALSYVSDLQTVDQEWKHEIDKSKIEKAAVRGDGSYVVEAKLPIPYYSESEGVLAINVQLNNVYDANVNANVAGSNCGFYGKQYTNIGNELDATIAALSDKEASVGGSDSTGDPIALVAALLAVSALGITVVAKKKEF